MVVVKSETFFILMLLIYQNAASLIKDNQHKTFETCSNCSNKTKEETVNVSSSATKHDRDKVHEKSATIEAKKDVFQSKEKEEKVQVVKKIDLAPLFHTVNSETSLENEEETKKNKNFENKKSRKSKSGKSHSQNSDAIKTNASKDKTKNAKNRREAIANKGNKFSALRKQLKESRKKDELPMADARLEQNYSAPYINRMAGVNSEQIFNKNNNKLRQLHNMHYPMREHGYVVPAEVECTFEEPCNWQWKNDVKNGFIVASRDAYGPTDTGPMFDADNKDDGKFNSKKCIILCILY